MVDGGMEKKGHPNIPVVNNTYFGYYRQVQKTNGNFLLIF